MKKDNFYKILELLYDHIQIIDAENGQSLEIVNALHVYQLVEEVIPKLLKAMIKKGWDISNIKVQVKR
jgi:flagellar hook-length control protein FliK